MAKFLGISDPVRNIITVPNEESGRRKRTFVEKLPACRPEGDASLFIGGGDNFLFMEMTRTKEAGLIARILTGEKELFHELIRPYERMVYLTLFSIVRNETEAEDGAQEAVISAYRHLASFRGDAKFSTWLTTIAINEGRKRLRKAKGAAEDSIEEKEESHEGDYTPAPLTDWRGIPLEALEVKGLGGA